MVVHGLIWMRICSVLLMHASYQPMALARCLFDNLEVKLLWSAMASFNTQESHRPLNWDKLWQLKPPPPNPQPHTAETDISCNITSASFSFISTMDIDNTSSSSFFYFSITNCSSSGSPPTCFHPVHLIAGVITAISCLLGIPANIAVIVKLSQELRGSSMSQRLFFNLALSDLLSLMCLPLYGVIFFAGLHLTNLTCQLLFYSFSFISMSSLNTRVLLSVQRYYQVCNCQSLCIYKVFYMYGLYVCIHVWMYKSSENVNNLGNKARV